MAGRGDMSYNYLYKGRGGQNHRRQTATYVRKSTNLGVCGERGGGVLFGESDHPEIASPFSFQ